MARRPRLTDQSFLGHIFSPKKNPKPTGLRKNSLSFNVTGRKKARVTAYNKMPAEKQEILRRTGSVEAYLRGDITITDAKRQLRQTAVQQGIVKPLRPRGPALAHDLIDELVISNFERELAERFTSDAAKNRLWARLPRISGLKKAQMRQANRMEIRERATYDADYYYK